MLRSIGRPPTRSSGSAFCPSSDTPDGSLLVVKLLYLDLPTDMPGADAHRRVSVERCKPCTNPHDRGDMPKKYFQMG